jgi:hypothetical protein
MVSFTMLVSWETWKEKNAHVFQNQAITSTMLVSKIKDEICRESRLSFLLLALSMKGFVRLLKNLLLFNKNDKSFSLF